MLFTMAIYMLLVFSVTVIVMCSGLFMWFIALVILDVKDGRYLTKTGYPVPQGIVDAYGASDAHDAWPFLTSADQESERVKSDRETDKAYDPAADTKNVARIQVII